MTGDSNFKYYVLINVDGKVLNVRASNGTYSYALKSSDTDYPINAEDIDVEISNDSTLDSNVIVTLCPVSEGKYLSSNANNVEDIASCAQTGCTKTTVGTELIIGGENFYVVSSDSTNTVLLSKYLLNTSTNSQSEDDYSEEIFSNYGYWDGAQCGVYGDAFYCNLSAIALLGPYNKNGAAYCTTANKTLNNCAYVYDNNSIISIAINAYVEKISIESGVNVSGRLLSLEESKKLHPSIRTIGKYYWLGSAKDHANVWVVSINKNSYTMLRFNGYSPGIRPVIIVPTSAL